MCGIAGIFKTKDTVSGEDVRLVNAMTDLLKYRGPDDAGIYKSNRCAIGHRRLSIIDLRMGKQPIFNEDKTIMVVCNGEIYNYKELREELLRKGHIFYTNSDTEVIVHAYEEWTENCFVRLNGMFAITVFDEKKNVLMLARDRIGMKPLYFWDYDGTLIWASEIKAILLHREVKPAPNYEAICDFAAFQNSIDEKTFFKGIKKVLPGHFLKATTNNTEIRQYWDLEFEDGHNFSGIKDALAVYETTFRDAVKRHLVSDVEIGSCLSGGFDSSSVAFWASRFLDYPIKTFTGFFPGGAKYDERNITRTFNGLFNTEAVEIKITPDDFRENIEKVIYHLDEPTLGSGALPQYMVSKEISKHVKVVLTGHGGDELFAGYQVYKAAFYKDLLRTDLPQFAGSFWNNRPDEIWKVLYFSLFPMIFPEVKYGLFNMFDSRQRSRLFTNDFSESVKGYSPARNLEEKYLKGRNFSNTERVLYLYLKTYLPTLFIQEDKVGMAHSIESRMPICDSEMVGLAARIPYQFKLYGNELKYLTKTAMKQYFPEKFYHHPKMGFPTPIAGWFRNELKDFVHDKLISDNDTIGIFRTQYLKDLLDNHNRWRGDTLYDYVRANKIYSLLAIQIWFKQFMK